LRTINSPEFDPAVMAIIEEDLQNSIYQPDSNYVELTLFTPNEITYNIYTDKQSLLKLSEVDYPPGWKIFIDENKVNKIYRTDHAIQSIIVPPGEHNIDMRFEPDSYFRDIKIAYASLGVLYATILISVLSFYLKKKKPAE
ncbi:MAG: YfhO family protein, partial [Calditrichaceae bacterium]